MNQMLVVVFLSYLLQFSEAQESRYASEYRNLYTGPYEHIYPPANIAENPGNCTPSSNTRCPLFIAAMFGFGPDTFTASGVIPAMQLAIDQINDNPNFLPGYRLHLLVKDSQVFNYNDIQYSSKGL